MLKIDGNTKIGETQRYGLDMQEDRDDQQAFPGMPHVGADASPGNRARHQDYELEMAGHASEWCLS